MNDERLEAALEAVKIISKQLDDAKQDHARGLVAYEWVLELERKKLEALFAFHRLFTRFLD